MDEATRRRIHEIIDDMSCPKDFRCADSGFEVLCSARDRGMETFLECLETGEACRFRLRFGKSQYCSCPLRVYLARKLGSEIDT